MSTAAAFGFFFALLNPFLLSLYLIDFMVFFEAARFRSVLQRGVIIAGSVFSIFAWTGDRFFSSMLHVKFASFQIFGGVVFLVVGIRFFFEGTQALRGTRGDPEHLSGSVAMPFLIGPATVSASILIGTSLPVLEALGIIWLTLLIVSLSLIALKYIHDAVRERHIKLIDRYVDISGRVSALMIGTFAIEMIGTGASEWAKSF